MSLSTIKLKDCCTKIGSGATPKGGSMVYIEDGTSLIRSQNVYNFNFDYSGLTHITEEATKKLDGVAVNSGDILLNITGDSVARVCMVPDDVLPARVNQHVSIIRTNNEILNNRFLLYYLGSPYMQAFMLNLAVGKGASRNAMTKGMIENFEVPLLHLDVQNRIADILSAYDDLIENNRKQIKLLEEAAQRLYQEWFVDLRFPGHEHTSITDGIPEGWEIRTVDSFGMVITGKTPSTSKNEYYGTDIPFVTIPDMHNTVYPLRTERSLSIVGADSQRGKYIPADSIVVSCIATVGLVNITYSQCQTNQQINAVVLKDRTDLYYFYFSMRRIKALLDGVGSNGATMTNVSKSKFGKIKILYPKEELVARYYDFCEPIFNKILILSKQLCELEQARDRLLPKLMRGEIEV